MTTALFSNIEKSLLSNIKNTKNNLTIAVAWFTNPKLFDAIKVLLNDGKKIEIILADDSINFTNKTMNFQDLIDKGVEIRISRFPHLMHHKFCIIDNRLLISGSYNWTNNAEFNNHENVIISNELNLVSQFDTEFLELKKKTEKLVSISATTFNSYISNIETQEELNLVTKVDDSSLNRHYKEEIKENQEYEIDEETKELFESANLQYLQGKHQKAIDICQNILTNYPNLADAYELIAASKWRQGKYKEQIENAQKAVDLDNLFYEAYNNLGIGYAHIRNSQKSIENYQICINAEPDNYTYYRNRALSYIDLETDSAVPKSLREQFAKKANLDLLKTIELTNHFETIDNNYKLYYSRGVANFYLKKFIPAKNDLEKALNLYESSDKNKKDSNELKEIKQIIKDIIYMR
ncbi:MAG: phospholipase D-like domain-containing protein [Emticicia sp.]|uniref:phospholipase D-like domain-containing protein n=1 Tax=Emticicia sp. TaxID=1930953 RepID=UPI003BA541EF